MTMGLLESVVGNVIKSQLQGGAAGGGGGLGGLLGGLGGLMGGGAGNAAAGATGAAGGSPLIGILGSLLANNGSTGGLDGLTKAFQQNGMGDVIGSWVGSGQNLPISPDALGKVLGPNVLGQLTQQAGGASQGDLLGQLSQLLPGVVDQMTPGGQAPQGGFGDLASLIGKFAGK
jgi:uncharacterized protein YidB (DUF937 family)